MNIIEKLLDIPDIEIKSIEINEKDDVVITVKSTIDVTRCHKCGSLVSPVTVNYH